MIYQQHSAEADVPATKEMVPPVGSSSCFCSYAVADVAVAADSVDSAAATAAASSGSFCSFAAAVAAVDSATAVGVDAKHS